VAIEAPTPTEAWVNNIVDKIVPTHAKRRLESDREVDFSYYEPGIGRFRTNVFQQRGTWAIAMRYVKTQVPSFEELGLLPILREIARSPRGIVLVWHNRVRQIDDPCRAHRIHQCELQKAHHHA